jgi:hypothetical protein
LSVGGFSAFVETVLTPVVWLFRQCDWIEKRIEAAVEARMLAIEGSRFDRAFTHPVIGRVCDMLVRSTGFMAWVLAAIVYCVTMPVALGVFIPFMLIWSDLNPGLATNTSIACGIVAELVWMAPFLAGYALALSALGGLTKGLGTLKVRYENVQWAEWVRRGNSQNVTHGWVYSRS